jgi:hypothetical protein
MGLQVQPASANNDDKVMRLRAQTAKIEGHFVLFPEKAPWLDTYLLELTTFPNARPTTISGRDRPRARLAHARGDQGGEGPLPAGKEGVRTASRSPGCRPRKIPSVGTDHWRKEVAR